MFSFKPKDAKFHLITKSCYPPATKRFHTIKNFLQAASTRLLSFAAVMLLPALSHFQSHFGKLAANKFNPVQASWQDYRLEQDGCDLRDASVLATVTRSTKLIVQVMWISELPFLWHPTLDGD